MRRTRTDLVLLSFVGVYWLTLMPQQAHFDRYVLPLVPVLAVLAGSIRAAVPLALVALALPLAWTRRDTRELTRTDTRLRADAWVGANVPRADRDRGRPVDLARSPGRRRRPARASRPRSALGSERGISQRLRREGVKWVIVSGAVTDRVLAAPDRYPREALFYERLGHTLRAGLRRLPGRARPRRPVGSRLPAIAGRRDRR